jgi:hypothetical protein
VPRQFEGPFESASGSLMVACTTAAQPSRS